LQNQKNIITMTFSVKEEDDVSKRHKDSRNVENVLVLQGGGSLGSFACGVFKALVKRTVRIDIVAGTSVGAVNAAIIAGSKSDSPEKDLENFWIEIAESSHNIFPDIFVFDYDSNAGTYVRKKISAASANAAIFGVPKMFVPIWEWSSWLSFWNRWGVERNNDDDNTTYYRHQHSDPTSWTYLYDHSPLAKTLDKYIDYKKHNLPTAASSSSSLAHRQEGSSCVSHLIMTAVDVMTASPLVFDNTKMEIKTKHILASSGYPIYGFPWIKVEDNVYAWDGSLLSNTPVREVLDVSPRNDKNIFIVENYPRKIKRLPSNMAEVESRAKDIIFSDKNMDNIKMSRLITRQIQLIERLYDIVEKKMDQSTLDPQELEKINAEYKCSHT
jgi:NTE family protein